MQRNDPRRPSILEDVGLSRQIDTRPEEAHDVVYRRICHGWSPEPPVTVTNDPRFCDCQRRWKWPPQALIDSLEYNWPVIPGSFVTYQDCYESYMQFHMPTATIRIQFAFVQRFLQLSLVSGVKGTSSLTMSIY